MSLSRRFDYIPRAHIPLSPFQAEALQVVHRKLIDGVYRLEHVDCLCGDPGGEVIAQRDRYGLPVTTVLCRRCGILRSRERMDEASTAAFYRDHYRDLYCGEAKAGALFAEQVERGSRYLERLAPLWGQVRTFYEVGCGAGGMLKPFAEAGFQVAGCDFDSDYLEYGRSQGLNLVEGGAEKLLEETGEPADMVLLSHVFEHFLDPRRELAEVLRVLRPGGYLIIEVPGIHHVEWSFDDDLLRYLQNAHNYHFTATTLRWVLESCGLEVFGVDEGCVAFAHYVPPPRLSASIPPPAGEALRIMRFLADCEKRHLQRGTPQQPSAA